MNHITLYAIFTKIFENIKKKKYNEMQVNTREEKIKLIKPKDS